MDIIKDQTVANCRQTFQTSTSKRSTNLSNFFEELYSSPQRVTLKWENISEFEDDLSTIQGNSFSKWDPNYSITEEATQNKYPISEYVEGYLKKLNSSTFYNSKTGEIQTALSSVPVFSVVNCDNEIVLNQVSSVGKPAGINSYLKRNFYNFCGGFDFYSQAYPEVGFFFFNLLDAENYLESIAKADMDGTKTVGLAIHCIGLDSAYKITREDHPGVDFRFVPDLNNLKNSTKTVNGLRIYIVDYTERKNLKKFVFFDRDQATNFLNTKLQKTTKPKLTTSSLENFLEQWEEKIYSTQNGNKPDLNSNNIFFVSPLDNEDEVLNYEKLSKGQEIIQGLGQKARILKRFIGTFFSVK